MLEELHVWRRTVTLCRLSVMDVGNAYFFYFIIKYPIRKDGVIRYEFPMHLLLIFIVHAFPFIGTTVIVRCAR